MKKLASVISVIFHPTLLPIWLICIVLFCGKHDLLLDKRYFHRKILLLTLFFVFTFFLPILNIFVLFKLKYISTFQMDGRKERTMPYTIGLVYYAGLFYLLNGSDIQLYFKALVVACFFLILFTLIINLKWKISAHAIGSGGFVGALLFYSLFYHQDIIVWIAIAFLIGGLSCSARLLLQKHSNAQIYSGYLLGISVSLLAFSFYSSIVLILAL